MKNLAFVAMAILLLSFSLGGCASTQAAGLSLADEYYNLGNSWFDLKKYELASRAYEKALSWNPSLKIAALNLARTRAELGDPAEALRLVESLGIEDSSNLLVAQYRAWLTARQKGPASAADLYAELAQRLPGDAATLFNAAVCLSEAKRPSEALSLLLAWKGLEGKASAGLNLLATVMDELKDPRAAEAWFDAAGSYPEGDARRFAPLGLRARALEELGQYGDASTAWSAALALPSAADQNRGEAQFRLGSLQIRDLEDYAPGIENLLAAWKAGYHDEAAWKSLRATPHLKYAVQLEADLTLAGVKP